MRSLTLPHRVGILTFAWALALALQSSSAFAGFTDKSAAVLSGANYSSRSASLADYDDDGDLDLMFQTSAGPKFYTNNLIKAVGTPSFTFSDATTTMLPTGLDIPSWSAAWGDYNSDGKVDVFVGASSGTGTLLKNNGASTPFTNVNSSTNLNTTLFADGFSQNVGWGDFNNDHRLDLVVGMEGPTLNQMYLQQANGKFSESGTAVGIQTPVGNKSYGLAIGDYDGDGDLDIYISTCSNNNIRNNFYKNNFKESGTLTFTDIADTNGTQNTKNTYGSQFVDMDNDGKLDLVVTGADGNPTKIFRNGGNGKFADVDTIIGHPLPIAVGSDLNGLKLVDYDNDGKLDLYFHDNLSGSGNQKLFHNKGNWDFEDVTTGFGLDGLAVTGAGSYDSVWGDIDLDGDQDLIDTNNSSAIINHQSVLTPEKVFINDASTTDKHWLYVKLNGPSWNTTGIGASLYATPADGSLQGTTLRREANTDVNTFNQSDLPVHFGLDTSSVVGWLRVVWPDGTTQFLHNVTANQYLTVSYASALAGDFNGDSTVDVNDYVLWRKYYGAPFTSDDYNAWRVHFGQSLPSGFGAESSVPEPAAIMMLGMAGLALLLVRRR